MEEKKIIGTEFAEGGKIEQQPEDHPMNALLEGALDIQRLKRGDIVEGTIVSVTPTEVLVDVNAKSEGVVPSKELERLGREGLDGLEVGAKIYVYVVRPEDRDGDLILSIRRAEEETDWKEAQKRFEAGAHFESEVAGFNKGGLIIRLGKLRGFVPASQLTPSHQGSGKLQPEERWARLVGITLHVKIIELDRKRKRLILSERAAMRFRREAEKERLLGELRVGEVRTGTVSSLTDFGAFVDLGGADGLVHLSELSWNRSDKPRDVLSRGQEVEVYVLNVDREKKRIALSLKRLEPEPWTTVESRYYVGQLVEGTVTRLANFGAFALVNDEIEGLIHISELSSGRINHPQEVVQEGEQHVMRIIRIDPRRRRMGLSLRRVADPSYADMDWRAELAASEASFEAEETDVVVDESVDEVAEEIVDEVADEAVDEVVDEAVQELAVEAEVVVETVDESADEAADEAVEEFADEVVDETVQELAVEAEVVVETVDESVDEVADEAVEEFADEVVDEAVQELAVEAEVVVETVDESVDEVADEAVEEVEAAQDEAANESVD